LSTFSSVTACLLCILLLARMQPVALNLPRCVITAVVIWACASRNCVPIYDAVYGRNYICHVNYIASEDLCLVF